MACKTPEKEENLESENSVSEGEDDENDEIVTMMDVLEQENEQEDNVNAVLGGSDDKTCTYSQGYVPRQPLYACKTCCAEGNGGVCLACSYKCHEGHDIVELYTRRNFRCDCGNSKFFTDCALDPEKDEVNEENKYDQNFKGLYCTCHRPYPDPEDSSKDYMSQCLICEDWYHSRHLKDKNNKLEEKNYKFEGHGEIICHLCMEKLPFLRKYIGKDLLSTTGDCKVSDIPDDENAEIESVIWPIDWRKSLCRCQSCLQLYEKNQVSFLLEEIETADYAIVNKERAEAIQKEREHRALSSLNHVQRIEVIRGFNEMKSGLVKHLQKFKDSNKVVSGADIREYFDELQAKRRRLMVPPSTCR